MTSYKHQYDVIGPICSGYVPFCPVVTDCATAFRVEVARLEEPVHILDFRQSFIAKIAIEKASCGGDRTAVPSDEIFTKRTLYHRASRPRLRFLFIAARYLSCENFFRKSRKTYERDISSKYSRYRYQCPGVDSMMMPVRYTLASR